MRPYIGCEGVLPSLLCFSNWIFKLCTDPQKTIPVEKDTPTVGVNFFETPEKWAPDCTLIGPMQISLTFMRRASTIGYMARLK